MQFNKNKTTEFVRAGKSYSNAGSLTVALGLLFASEILWAEGSHFPKQSVIMGIFCIIAGVALVVYGRRKNVGANPDTDAKNDT
ncbi:MAG: hypothetical protein K2G04_00565 [Oscillospiraceae bacterium]|nr:hypothetical protein [Oscillospiraceae bacterium]